MCLVVVCVVESLSRVLFHHYLHLQLFPEDTGSLHIKDKQKSLPTPRLSNYYVICSVTVIVHYGYTYLLPVHCCVTNACGLWAFVCCILQVPDTVKPVFGES